MAAVSIGWRSRPIWRRWRRVSGLRVLAHAPYLRNLAALVLLSTAGSTLVDYVFKAEASSALGPGESLIRFFAIYYAATSVITFLLQTSLSRFALERFGLAMAGASPSLALIAGGAGALFSPGLAGITVARGGESVLRGSLFRAGYELFYTPIPRAEKRAAKSIIDVGFDRLGDAVGGGAVWIVLFVLPVGTVDSDPVPGDGLFGARRFHRQPVEPRLHSDARAEPAGARGRARSLGRRRRHDPDDRDEDAEPSPAGDWRRAKPRTSRAVEPGDTDHRAGATTRSVATSIGCGRATANRCWPCSAERSR